MALWHEVAGLHVDESASVLRYLKLATSYIAVLSSFTQVQRCPVATHAGRMPASLPPVSLLQPGRIEQQESLVIERKVLHGGGPIRLEKGICAHIHPLELIRQAPSDVGTDRLALLRLQRAAPLQHQRCQLGIVHTHVVRLPAFEE